MVGAESDLQQLCTVCVCASVFACVITSDVVCKDKSGRSSSLCDFGTVLVNKVD